MEAIDEFDLSKENRLSTFATIKIKQKIIKFLKNNRHKILINKLNDLKEEYYKINGTKLTDEEICQKLEISYEILSKIQKTTNITSLDIPINDDESLINTISSEENEIEENIFKKDLKNIVNNLLEHLSEPHKELIDLYFGLNGNEPISGHKIANMKGYTYQTFYKKLKTILNHLRKIKEVQDLTDYMQHPTTTINFLKICSGEISTNDIDHLEKHLFKTKKTKY